MFDIQEECQAIIETIDNVPSWSPQAADAFCIGYVRALRSMRPHDQELESLLYGISTHGLALIRRLAAPGLVKFILAEYGPMESTK